MSLASLIDVFIPRGYNTWVVTLSVAVLGAGSGVVGSFLLLRKRSLMGDALSHATLPGIALAFMLAAAVGGDPKSLPVLLAGAVVTGVAGVAGVLLITRLTRLKEDAAMAIVLSVWFGVGVALLGLVSDVPGVSAAGLESFIYGRTASMLWVDAVLIACVSAAATLACLVLFKELTLLCFDGGFARTQGWPVTVLDAALLALVTAVTVVGLQAVGLILVLALLVIPPAAARFWTDDLRAMVLVAAAVGAVSGWVGAMASAARADLPAGAVIVLVAVAVFGVSMAVGRARGVVWRWFRRRELERSVRRQHLLRAMYEAGEGRVSPDGELPPVSLDQLQPMRSWSRRGLRRRLASARRAGLVLPRDESGRAWRLTGPGRVEAARVVRNHRLWEAYLIEHAEVAPSHVDRGADLIEHVLAPELIARLEALLSRTSEQPQPPPSPHGLP